MKLSKLLAVLLALAMIAVACGGSDDDDVVTADEPASTDADTTDDEAVEDDEAMADDEAVEDDEAMADDEAMEDDEAMADDEAMEDDEAMADDEAMDDDEATPAAASGGSATIGLQLEPPTLDLTASPAAAIPQVLLYNVYETLVRLQPDGSITGLLAQDWTISDDGLTYTFNLVDGAMFHNGDPLTADDVVFSINNVVSNEDHPFTTTFAPITDVVAVDDATVEVTLSQPSANLLFFMTQGQGSILNQSSIGTIENSAIGTGPFTFGEWNVGDSITINRNDAYWGDAPPLDSVTFQYITDPNALNNAMLGDQLDVVAGVSAPELLVAFEADSRFSVQTGQTFGEVTLSLNGRRAPFDDIRVRQAVSHAIDRQAIVDLAYAGYGTPIGSFSTPLDPWFKDLTGVYEYNPDRARELLAEAGAEDLTIQLVLPPPSYASRGGEIIASQLAEVGVTAEITNVEWGVWLEDVFAQYDFDMSIVAHVEPFDLAQYGNPEYYWGDDSPSVAPILEQADAEPNEELRNELYGQVLDEITAQAADQWLFVLPALSVTRAGVTGYEVDLPGSLDVTNLTVPA